MRQDAREVSPVDAIDQARAKSLGAVLLAGELSPDEAAGLLARWAVSGTSYDAARTMAIEHWARSAAAARVLHAAVHRTGLPASERADCLQVALWQLFNAGHRYDPEQAPFDAWAGVVCLNAMRTYARGVRRRHEVPVADPPRADVAEPGADDGVFVAWLRREAAAVHPFWGNVYVRCVLGDIPKKELARQLGVPYRTFARRFNYVREQLAIRIEQSRQYEESQ